MDNCSKVCSCVSAFDEEFADPSGEIERSMILAFPSKPINSVYVSFVITPTSASAINSEAAFTEIVDDETFKCGPLCFLWIAHSKCLHLFG